MGIGWWGWLWGGSRSIYLYAILAKRAQFLAELRRILALSIRLRHAPRPSKGSSDISRGSDTVVPTLAARLDLGFKGPYAA